MPADEQPDSTQSLLAPFERDVLLSSGRPVRIRPAAPADVDSLRSFYGQLDDRSTYLRFFTLRRFIPDDELERATVQDVHLQVTLVAEAANVVVGVGEYHASPGADDAEVAFAVADAHHHQGIATVLLEDLALIAQAAGFRRLVAETLPANAAMLGVFNTVGLVNRVWFEDGVVQVELDLTADALLQDDADLRDWKAVVRSLRSIVDPSHVVVIGPGEDVTSPGRRVLAHLGESFTGLVSVDDLAGAPDLAIIACPARDAVDAVTRCGAAGVRSAVVISSGFAETGEVGARLQDELLAAARRYGMRIVGPNSLGVVSTACGLNATITGQTFAPGGIAIASQSGGVGVAIAAEAQRRRAGISSFVSMGNKADVSGNDLLRLWADDEAANVVLLYLESFGDPVRFARVARAVSQRKPVVALKSGASAAGQRGARSHTAAIASDQSMVDALFSHTGVVRARTLEELIDVGVLLDRQPAPRGRRVALIGNAGGPLVLGADAADAAGLEVPLLSSRLQDGIVGLVPSAPSVVNPVDVGPEVAPDELAATVRTIARSGEVDACVVVCVDLGERHRLDEVAVLLADAALDDVTVALSLIGADQAQHASLPTFPTPSAPQWPWHSPRGEPGGWRRSPTMWSITSAASTRRRSSRPAASPAATPVAALTSRGWTGGRRSSCSPLRGCRSRPAHLTRQGWSCWSERSATLRSVHSWSSEPAERKPSCATTRWCSSRRSPHRPRGAPSRACGWRRCSMASRVAPSYQWSPSSSWSIAWRCW